MKTSKIIILSTISIVLTSCFSVNYRIVTHIDRNGSGWREIQTTTSKTDSLFKLFPYNLSCGWGISQTDTVTEENHPCKNVKIRKKINSINDLSADLRNDIIFPVAKESLKKHFRWFYTCYEFRAIYPEITDKGGVPLEKYLSKSEQKFYLQGDMSAYKGLNGAELKEELDGIETRFFNWYDRSMYEERYEIILHCSEADFRPKLIAAKDSVYSILKQQNIEQPAVKDICLALDKYSSTSILTRLFNENGHKMENMLEERLKTVENLSEYDIQYELILPGKITASNTELQNDGVLKWNINIYRFLSDDYTLTAESRKINLWAFAVTLLLIAFSLFLCGKTFCKPKNKRYFCEK